MGSAQASADPSVMRAWRSGQRKPISLEMQSQRLHQTSRFRIGNIGRLSVAVEAEQAMAVACTPIDMPRIAHEAEASEGQIGIALEPAFEPGHGESIAARCRRPTFRFRKRAAEHGLRIAPDNVGAITRDFVANRVDGMRISGAYVLEGPENVAALKTALVAFDLRESCRILQFDIQG